MNGHGGNHGKNGKLVLRIVELEQKDEHVNAPNNQHQIMTRNAQLMDHQKITIRIVKFLVTKRVI